MMNESKQLKLECKLWDGKFVKNFTGINTNLAIELKDTCFTAYASCDCDKLEEETGIWQPCHYLWKGEYKKISVVAIELLAKLRGQYQLHISVSGVADDVAFVFDNFKEANEFFKSIKNWLGWQ